MNAPPSAPPSASWWRRLWLWALAVALLSGAAAAAGWWRGWWVPPESIFAPEVSEANPAEPPVVVTVAGPRLVRVEPESRLARRLTIVPVQSAVVRTPLMTVTGNVVARLGKRTLNRTDPDADGEYWDFATAELATTYGDWVKARADVAFADMQLARVKELTKANVTYLTAVAKRKAKLTEIGTETEETKAAAEADRLKAVIQGQKDVFEAETAIRTAARTRDLLARQLLQAGIDPNSLLDAKGNLALIVADVPEARGGEVYAGQPCEARFVALPGQTFAGHVGRIAPSLSKERRTFRVIFRLPDPDSRLMAGLFADVGLGTEARRVFTLPADAVLHIGRSDVVLVRETDRAGLYRVVEIMAGEPIGDRLEIRKGLTGAEAVVGAGAILLKPAAAKAMTYPPGATP